MPTDTRRHLSGIKIAVEPPARIEVDTGNVPLILTEIRHALKRLLTDGTTHTIDLRAIPLGPGEAERLLETLGIGEVRAEFASLGRTEFQESSYHAVWRVTHWNAAHEVTGRFVEVAFTPALLASPPDDVGEGLARLTADLAGGVDRGNVEEHAAWQP